MKKNFSNNANRAIWVKVFFIAFISLAFFSRNIFAQNVLLGDKVDDAPQTVSKEYRQKIIDGEIQRWLAARREAKVKAMDDLAARREAAINDALYKSFYLKSQRQFYFEPWVKSYVTRAVLREPDSATDFFSLKNTRNELNVYFESEDEKKESAFSSLPSRRRRLFFKESLETDFSGSVYHPNLVSFDINLENGLKQSREKFQPNSSGEFKNSYLDQFHIVASALRKKPYTFSLSADKSREVENHEFFERQIINSTRYVGNFWLRNKFFPATFSFNESSKVIDRASRASQDFDDNELSFSLSNESKVYGSSHFEFAQNDFSRDESGTSEQSGISRDFNLANQRLLPGETKKTLNSGARYYTLAGTSKSKIFDLSEGLDIEHTEYLKSFYGYNFSERVSSGSRIKDNRVSASLQHKLYESLVSLFNTYYFRSDASQLDQDSYGVSFNEDYTKKMGRIGRLNSGAGLSYSDEKRRTSGNVISVIGEEHTVTTGMLAFLDKPRVEMASVIVKNQAGSLTYTLNTDYQLIDAGERTQIQRVPAGGIANGSVVKVDYQAQNSPLFKFNTLGQNYRVRFDFLEDLIGVFYKVNKEEHPNAVGSQDAILQKLTDTVIGLSFNYRNLNVELEDQDYDSNLSSYTQRRIKEVFSFNPSVKSTLTFQSSQAIVRLLFTQDTQKFFDFLSSYTLSVSRNSRLNLEGGFRWQDGRGVDLNDWFFSSGYELNFAKFQMDIQYDFKRQLYIGDKLTDHFLFIRTKRSF